MVTRTIAAALTLSLLAFALQAQEYTGYPETRVRQSRPESIPPDELYQQNRVIIRKTDLALVGSGIQVSGEVVTDFEADRVPGGKADIPKGQLMGLKVNVELYYWDTVFERDIGTAQNPGTNKVKMPQIDFNKEGQLVEGQSVTIKIDQTFGKFGLAKFTLPAITKPLAPGIYRLIATVRFKTQESKYVEAIRWCSDLYGARIEQDPVTLEITYKNVMQNEDLHEEVYNDLVNRIGSLRDETVIWMGEACKDGVVNLIPPEKGTEKSPANYLIWSYHTTVVEQILALQNQLDNVDAEVQKQLDAKLKTELKKDATDEEKAAHEERKKRWVKEAEEEKKRIKRDNKAQIDKLGGRTAKDEDKRFTTSVAARLAILEQVGRFHDYLTRCYWVLVDGYMQYAGWSPIYNAGYNACDAVTINDNKAQSIKRKDADKAVQDAPGGRQAKWDKRRADWQFVPPELTTYAFAYLKAKEETDVHDAEKFTAKAANKIELDTGKWAEFRMNFVLDFYEKSNEIIKQVTSTQMYAVQVWPQALSQLISVRDDIIALAYAWEYWTRKELMKEDAELIKDGWKREAEPIAAVPLADYFSRGMTAPGNIKTHFEASMNTIKSDTRIGDFKSYYSRAVQAQGDKPDPKNLPGVKPVSAWK